MSDISWKNKLSTEGKFTYDQTTDTTAYTLRVVKENERCDLL